jgi:hypothetical protein
MSGIMFLPKRGHSKRMDKTAYENFHNGFVLFVYSCRVNRLRRVRWVEHVAYGDKEYVQDSLKIRKGRDCFGDLCVDGNTVLKQILSS